MKSFEGKTPAEKNKAIAAIALGVVALLLVLRIVFGSSSTETTPPADKKGAATVAVKATPGATNGTVTTAAGGRNSTAAEQSLQNMRNNDSLAQAMPVVYNPLPPAPLEAGRNIFAFYVPPPTPVPAPPVVPTPTPAPPPPLILVSINPTNVYAGTGEFNIEVSGDKFTPAARIMIDNQEVPTRFVDRQKLTGVVPAQMIVAEGARSVIVRTPDGKLFSNTTTLNVAPAPKAPYTYVAIIGAPRYNDTAVLKEQGSNKLINVTRGQVVGDQWRVTSISDRELILTHTSIRGVKQRLAFVDQSKTIGNSGSDMGPQRPGVSPPPVQRDDDDSQE